MENLIVGLIVAGALVFSVRGFIKTYKGEGDCGCGSSCGGCRDHSDGGCSCDPNTPFK